MGPDPTVPVPFGATAVSSPDADRANDNAPVTGRIALHGGGEFLPGDEPFLDALLEAASHAAANRAGGIAEMIRIVVLPTAAARQRPDVAASNGVAALRKRAAAGGFDVWADVALVVDDASAADPELAESITTANLLYLPGGDPDLIPGLLDTSTATGRAVRDAYEGGSVLAGASAGAMALAEWTWTPSGGVPGLGFVPGVAVVPHFDDTRRLAWQSSLDRLAPGRLGYLGLDERTGVISAIRDDDPEWVVAGEGAAHWYAPGAADAVEARQGERLRLNG